MATWKRDAASGLVVTVPILLSIYVIYWLYMQIAGVPVLDKFERPVKVAVLLAVFAGGVLGVGYLMRTAIGDAAERWIDDLANRVPLVRVVYNASKMAVETTLTGTEELQTPVRIEPWDGMRMTAFKTGKTTPDGREVLFLPTAPNITTGFVIEVKPGEYQQTDERVEDALTRILSAGFGESREEAAPYTIGEEGDQGLGEDRVDEDEGVGEDGAVGAGN